jgi:hypothetical protein
MSRPFRLVRPALVATYSAVDSVPSRPSRFASVAPMLGSQPHVAASRQGLTDRQPAWKIVLRVQVCPNACPSVVGTPVFVPLGAPSASRLLTREWHGLSRGLATRPNPALG